MSSLTAHALHSLVTSEGRLKLSIDEAPVPAPGADEVVVRIEAAPLNPSDIGTLLAQADVSTLRAGSSPGGLATEADVPAARLPALAGRLDRPLPVGNEGAGVVVEAGASAQGLLGRTVAIAPFGGSYATYRTVKARDCVALPEGTSARDGASAFVNPLTALGMVETMRREGHTALVHTAAASNLGQMLNRLCLADGIPLVNVVRSPAQAEALRAQGATHVLDSTAEGFNDALVDAIAQTGATLGFDAIGGGRMTATILAAMEQVLRRKLPAYSRYGSPVHKQVYIYGRLDPGPRIIEGDLGMAWGVGGWLVSYFLAKLSPDEVANLRARVAREIKTTFASRYTAEIGLAQAVSPDVIRAYAKHRTGEKYLVVPNAPGSSK
jgi:NADPH:quinone reductase-like Zn-dependent oxidoreductase